MTDLDFDLELLFPSPPPAAPVSAPAPKPSIRKAGPRSANRDDAAVAEADNRRACRPRRSR